ncbi:predicted protein [Nematostella vectensis]|uniref:UspA domain-containing protein n=1 Tax=Nematostella vectensis TaxID=45351 RepID=A7RFF6_NEMVE|nr:universal stress protein A-like protein [Nematostella vectensis]EDO49708.1 predicted protein [Nematostella vectensis]|eukprot:XP_001641771.1 predicted protein [Nematostella vectensis]
MATESQQDTKYEKRRVLLAIDHSEHSMRAFEWYFENIHRDDNLLMLVHSQELPPIFIPPDAFGTTLYNEWLAEAKKASLQSKKLLEGFERMCKERHCECEKHLLEGDNPGPAIIKLIKKSKPNYVVIGSRGQSMVRRTVMGSVSDFIIHHAHVPVCISPP